MFRYISIHIRDISLVLSDISTVFVDISKIFGDTLIVFGDLFIESREIQILMIYIDVEESGIFGITENEI